MRPFARMMAAALASAPMAPLAGQAADLPAAAAASRPSPAAPGAARPGAPSGHTGAPAAPLLNPGDNPATPGSRPLENQSLPISPPPRVGLFPEFGQQLLDRGIDIHGVAFDHFLANPSAGSNPGQTNNLAVFAPSVDFDLERLAGIRGATVRVQAVLFGLKSDIPGVLSDTGGFLTGFQSTPSPITSLLAVLTYEQKLLDGRLAIEVGRSNVYNNFFLPNSLDLFTHFSSALEVTGDFNPNPFPVWSGRARYELTPAWYLQGGIFEDNFRLALVNGNNFSTRRASGATVLAEVGYRTDFRTAAYPANLEAGVLWNARSGTTNLKGTGRDFIPGLQAANYGSGGVLFMQGLQTVWRSPQASNGPPANIAVYGSADVAVGKPQPIDMDAIIGTNFTGFIPGRPFDALGLQAHYQRLSAIEAGFETRTQQRFAGPGPAQSRNGFAFEVVGKAQLTPAISLHPFVEYFVNPDNYYNPFQRRRPQDGVEAGLFAVVTLGQFFGTSQKPF